MGFTDRGIARQARQVHDLVKFLEETAYPLQEASSFDEAPLAAFIADGEQFEAALIDVLHGADARIVDRRNLTMWLKTATRAERATRGQ